MALLFGLTLTDHGNYSTNQPLPIMRRNNLPYWHWTILQNKKTSFL